MMDEKKTGYILLGVGLLIMTFAFISIILLFTGLVKPLGIFNIPAPSFNTSNLIPQVPGIPTAKGEKVEVIPTEELSNIINLATLFFLMTFVMSFGYKIADLGVKLLRPIKIEAKAQ